MGTRSRQGSQEAEAAAPPAVAVAPAQGEAAAAPAAGSGELDAKAKMAYTTSEMYRSQGNEAFRDSDYSAAYDLYTKALQALWPYPPLHPRLALLLSNRAAALLSQGKPLSALADCQMGLKYDPGLMRCALRVATCHSRMGNFDEAFQFVAKLRTAAAGVQRRVRVIAELCRSWSAAECRLSNTQQTGLSVACYMPEPRCFCC
jgi:tetratricopeptide (TPR) repeat protein